MRKNWQLILENVQSRKEVEKVFVGGEGKALKLLMVIGIGFLLSRAFFLQVVTGRQNRVLAEENKVEVIREAVERGVIVDRSGQFLAKNDLNEKNQLIREYPLHEAAAHLVGYIGQVSEAELKSCRMDESCAVEGGDKVGKAGVEKLFDSQLLGTKSESIVERSATGTEIRRIKRREGEAGKKIQLTVDGELQQKIWEVLKKREAEKGEFKGAVVVSRVEDGQILGMSSFPGYDDNLFTSGGGTGEYENVTQILSDTTRRPMLNRAVGAMYPPGSIFKLVVATAGLQEKKISAETVIEPTGAIKIGQVRYGNWYFDQYGRKEGGIGLKRAITRSNDIFFYKVGEWLGVDDLVVWAKKFGFGQATGLDWPGEANGLLPDPLEKERRTGERWFLGNTYHLAIGQGDLLATPLQINMMTAAVLTGKKCVPRLRLDGESACVDLGTKASNRQLIFEGMRGACAVGGPAFPFFDFPIPIICKTGTAQHGGEKTLPHAWISVVVPAIRDSGEYVEADYEKGVVISVMLEEAGEGSYEAGPVARAIAEFVINRRY